MREEWGGGGGKNTYLGGVLGDIYGLGGGYLFGEKHFLEWGAYSRKYSIGEKRRHGTQDCLIHTCNFWQLDWILLWLSPSKGLLHQNYLKTKE